MVTVTLGGSAIFAAKIEERARRAAVAVASALLQQANITVPYGEGKLSESGHVIEVPGNPTAAAVSYPKPYGQVQYAGNRDIDENGHMGDVNKPATFNYQGNGRAHWIEKAAQENAAMLHDVASRVMRGEL